MTTEEHNKYLGMAHLAYGGLQSIMMLAMFGFFLIISSAEQSRPGGPPPEFFLIVTTFILIFSLIFTLPSLIAGYGLLKQKQWARMAGIIAGVMAGMSFPHGVAVCAYSMWFLFGEKGKELYEKRRAPWQQKQRGALYGAPEPAGWAAQYASRGRGHEYVPREPPNWRD
jgi:hypothetical protein